MRVGVFIGKARYAFMDRGIFPPVLLRTFSLASQQNPLCSQCNLLLFQSPDIHHIVLLNLLFVPDTEDTRRSKKEKKTTERNTRRIHIIRNCN